MLATLVDATMGAAVRSTVDGEAPATSQLTLTYLRPGKGGRLVVTAEVSKRGESLTMCEARGGAGRQDTRARAGDLRACGVEVELSDLARCWRETALKAG